LTASNIAAWTIPIIRYAAYGVYGDETLASGATAAMAFSSQSVMTLAHAGAAAPTASQAPIVAAQTERFTAWAIEAGIFPSI
jgi:hypothetical protein